MPFRRALFSVVTLFGGHFLNRRLDRVVLVGALLIVPVVALIGVPYVLYNGPKFSWALKLPLILVGALALLSAELTFRDAKQPAREPLTTTMRVTGVALSFVGVILVAAVLLVSATRYTPVRGTETGSEHLGPTALHRPFHGYVSFGGGADTFDLPAPPSGAEWLRGRITLDGAGAEGVKLYLILNGKYKVDNLTSDSRGVFEFHLPAGNWYINSIAVSEWNTKPEDRDLVLFSDREPTKGANQYTRYDPFRERGLEISLPLAENAIPVKLELRDALPITWPPRSHSFGVHEDASVPDADFSTAAIAWRPVEGASEYEVQIAQVTHEGTTTVFTPILMRRLAGWTLPLASLPQRSVSSAPADEYSVHVYAFDANGKLLTESGADLDDRMFKLTGGTRLGKEQQYSFGRPSPEVISVEYEINDLRLSLAAKLLDQKQFAEARRLLDQVTQDAPRGRAAVLHGRLAALQGDCMTARRMFDRADAEGGSGCVPIEYRNLCVAAQK